MREEDLPEADPYDEALETMPPLEAAAHRTVNVLGCIGVLGGLGGGIGAAVFAWKVLGVTTQLGLSAAVAAGSVIPFLATGLLELNRRRALHAAKQAKPRLTAGTHAALTAYDGEAEHE